MRQITPSARAGSAERPDSQLLAPPVGVAPYLSTDQLAQLTPWTVQAINTMRKRGVFKPGVHYFQPAGKGGQVIFKWAAVVELIEKDACQRGVVVKNAPPRRKRLNVEEATAAVQQLLD
jgi:hypothetical protein